MQMFRVLLTMALLTVMAAALPLASTQLIPRVIIDTDAAMTVDQPQFPHPTDIDDDLALLYALHMERLGRLRVQGIISTFGNANQTSTNADVHRLAREAGIQAPIYRGGDWNTSLLTVTPGSEYLATELRRVLPWERPPTLVNIGALYTLASTLSQHPSLVGKLGDIVLLGGSTVTNRPISTNYFADLNFKADPEATNVVLGLPVKKVTLPMELCMQALWSDREWELIHRPQCINSVISAHYPRVQQWMHQMGKDEREAFHNWPQYGSATMGYENVTGHKNYTIPWDALAMAYVTNPEWFGDERCYTMQLIMKKPQRISAQEVPCSQCEANNWVFCVVVPMNVSQPVAFFDSLTRSLCEVDLKLSTKELGSTRTNNYKYLK